MRGMQHSIEFARWAYLKPMRGSRLHPPRSAIDFVPHMRNIAAQATVCWSEMLGRRWQADVSYSFSFTGVSWHCSISLSHAGRRCRS